MGGESPGPAVGRVCREGLASWTMCVVCAIHKVNLNFSIDSNSELHASDYEDNMDVI